MPTITRDEVQRLARLARLELSNGELDLFARQLGNILEFVRQIESVDTAPAPEAARTGGSGSLREDVVQPSLDRDEVLAHAPGADRTAGLFKVPRVING